MAFWNKRNRNRNRPRQASVATPSLLARIDWRRFGVAAGTIMVAVAVALLLRLALDRPVRRVLVEGSFQRVSPPEIENVVARAVNGGLASVDLEAVRHEVEKIPWVDDALVTRQWPDAVRVRIVEQVAAARWNDTGLLNTRGEL